MKDPQGHGSGPRGGMTEKQKDQQVVDNIRGWLGVKPGGMAKVSTNRPIGSRVADIGPGGKEYNVKTDAAWNAAHQTGVAAARAVPRHELEGRSAPPAKWSGKTARQRVGGTFGS
jgi:hypothetical protein